MISRIGSDVYGYQGGDVLSALDLEEENVLAEND